MIEVEGLRKADALRWHPYTVFQPGSGIDGRLYVSNRELDVAGVTSARGMPLDIYTPDEVTSHTATLTGDGVGIAVAPVTTPSAAEAAIKQWCRDNLGRDDISFDKWDIEDA